MYSMYALYAKKIIIFIIWSSFSLVGLFLELLQQENFARCCLLCAQSFCFIATIFTTIIISITTTIIFIIITTVTNTTIIIIATEKSK